MGHALPCASRTLAASRLTWPMATSRPRATVSAVSHAHGSTTRSGAAARVGSRSRDSCCTPAIVPTPRTPSWGRAPTLCRSRERRGAPPDTPAACGRGELVLVGTREVEPVAELVVGAGTAAADDGAGELGPVDAVDQEVLVDVDPDHLAGAPPVLGGLAVGPEQPEDLGRPALEADGCVGDQGGVDLDRLAGFQAGLLELVDRRAGGGGVHAFGQLPGHQVPGERPGLLGVADAVL